MGISLTAFQVAPLVRKTIQTIDSMGIHEFKALYGEKTGAHLWHKYAEQYERDAGRLICGMDDENLARMVQNAITGEHLDTL